MTAPQPAIPGSDSVREQIAEVLAHWPIGSGYYATNVGTDDAREMADALLPLVDVAKAEALEEAAKDYWLDADHTRWPDAVVWLRDRAAAYRATTPNKETDRGE